ncbi:uncharacterized protein LOC135698594 [Ochlerotatus camptorhynchus]|uniref:uncharacterized protein LOC135698594 n=1 Tax=Ochlerotatus camptorhynchus TaxID=644619 RepID=UPI0031E3B748
MLHQQNSNRNPNQLQASKPIQSPPNSEQTQSQAQNPRSAQGVPTNTLTSATPVVPSVPVVTPSLSHCSTSLVANVRSIPSTVLLQTALVKIIDSNGYLLWARALLDPASQLNVISEHLVQRLHTRKIKDHHTIGGIGRSTTVSTHSVLLSIRSHCTNFSADLKFHVLSEITRDLPSNAVDTTNWEWPSDIVFADPKFHEPASVDMIIGMEIYYDLLLEGFLKLGPGKPVLQKTMLGWVVSGRVGLNQPPTSNVVAHVCSTQAVEDQLTRFWEIESCQSSSTMSVEESSCEAHFAATTTRDNNGRFVVTLPKKPEVLQQLGNSYPVAKRRLLSLSRRLEANPLLKTAYSEFIQEYLQLGHMQEVSEDSLSTSAFFYLPHHCIVRPDSLTTKLRVVFDASCATDTGISLNDALMVGPVVQEDLICITMRFRVPRYAIISDVEKMYRQIWVYFLDCLLQQILWLDKPDGPIRIFQLKTVTYGTSAVPYLATKCLQELANQGQSSHPAASRVLANDFYMDDMISGVDDVEEGKVLCSQLLQLLQTAGFSLRKWASNSPEILEHIPAHLRDERSVLDLDSTSSVKTLGLKWTPSSDELGFHVPKWNKDDVITKRIALSDSARLYDPLGLVGPVIVLAKCFMQELWMNKKTWDEPLEEELQQRWVRFRSELTAVETIAVPRWVIPIPQPVVIEAHGFSDASLRAYGACIYLRVVSPSGEISVQLLTSKSKVAPLGNSKNQKKISLPRLELSGALLLSHLFQKVQHSLKIDLNWNTITMEDVCSKQGLRNTAHHYAWQLGTRGWPRKPGGHHLPWNATNSTEGFGYLVAWSNLAQANVQALAVTHSSHTADDDFLSEDLEERSIALPVQIQPPNPILSLRSSFPSLVRLVAYLRRFSHNCKPANRQDQMKGFLRTTELNQATYTLVRFAQAESFPNDLRAIRSDGQVKPNSKLKSLSPIIVDGILRIGGRLRNASVSEDRKHPIILATHHPLTELIITSYHEKLLHAGPQLLIASVREKYWPLRVRNLARKIMGDLPAERVTPTFPFFNTGVDLCGPLFYRHAPRKSSPVKCYVAIFVCLATKAVHIELVADLSTNAFITTLKRFVARRGRPAVIECDNAKNFVGASRTLAELHEQFSSQQHKHAVTTYCGEEGIHFKFIPPRSPNFGGLWEAAVKSFKKHFKATIGTTVLLKDDIETLLTQIESCLNSRPLTQLTSDPEDLEILTPGHFLVHRPLVSIPEPSYEKVPTNRLDRYQQTQEFVRRIWKRWSMDYLSGLHPRTRWTRLRDNISIGTMVLLKGDNLPPLKWRCGRVTQIFRGDDGNVRVVSVRTQDGEYRRAITKVCVLPVQQPASAGTNDLLSEM